jgi:hypothetical protein
MVSIFVFFHLHSAVMFSFLTHFLAATLFSFLLPAWLAGEAPISFAVSSFESTMKIEGGWWWGCWLGSVQWKHPYLWFYHWLLSGWVHACRIIVVIVNTGCRYWSIQDFCLIAKITCNTNFDGGDYFFWWRCGVVQSWPWEHCCFKMIKVLGFGTFPQCWGFCWSPWGLWLSVFWRPWSCQYFLLLMFSDWMFRLGRTMSKTNIEVNVPFGGWIPEHLDSPLASAGYVSILK